MKNNVVAVVPTAMREAFSNAFIRKVYLEESSSPLTKVVDKYLQRGSGKIHRRQMWCVIRGGNNK